MNASGNQLTLWVDGLGFPEGLRWHDGALWFSDIVRESVVSVPWISAEVTGVPKVVATIEGRPSGLGFDGGGRLLATSMRSRELMRIADAGVLVVADLAAHVGRALGDMASDPGRGVSFLAALGETDLDGSVLVVTDEGGVIDSTPVAYPNGIAMTSASELIVADTFAGNLLSFHVSDDGLLTPSGIFAHLGDRKPDGFTVDASGAVWVGCYDTGEFLRVLRGGEVTDVIDVAPRWGMDCALGGEDGRTLFLATALADRDRFNRGETEGSISVIRVDTPGLGF
jgi:sugar lactone lactonase YvrE